MEHGDDQKLLFIIYGIFSEKKVYLPFQQKKQEHCVLQDRDE